MRTPGQNAPLGREPGASSQHGGLVFSVLRGFLGKSFVGDLVGGTGLEKCLSLRS